MKKYLLALLLCSLLSIAGCATQHDTIETIGNKRYTPSYPIDDNMGADGSGRLHGAFSRYNSNQLGVSFEYISDASVFSTGDSMTHITRSGNMLSMNDQFSSRLFMIVFSGKNIAGDKASIQKYFNLSASPSCQMTDATAIVERAGTSNNAFMYYALSFSGTDFPQDGKSFCPHQERSSIVPLLIIDKAVNDKMVMTFVCEGCGPETDLSWLKTLKIVQ